MPITQQPQKPEKISKDMKSLLYVKNFDARLTKFKNNQSLLDKNSHRFLVPEKLIIE
jgi:hypothetical protein